MSRLTDLLASNVMKLETYVAILGTFSTIAVGITTSYFGRVDRKNGNDNGNNEEK
jgi:hypothetical protein